MIMIGVMIAFHIKNCILRSATTNKCDIIERIFYSRFIIPFLFTNFISSISKVIPVRATELIFLILVAFSSVWFIDVKITCRIKSNFFHMFVNAFIVRHPRELQWWMKNGIHSHIWIELGFLFNGIDIEIEIRWIYKFSICHNSHLF